MESFRKVVRGHVLYLIRNGLIRDILNYFYLTTSLGLLGGKYMVK